MVDFAKAYGTLNREALNAGDGSTSRGRMRVAVEGLYGFLQEENYMAHVITDSCVKCGACKDVCPVSAISEGDPIYVIDAGTCIDCGACVGECPTGSIKPE